MKVMAEISLYPLQTGEIGETISRFLKTLEDAGLVAHVSPMSSRLDGDVETLFSGVGKAFEAAARNDRLVLVMKVSNACPSGPG